MTWIFLTNSERDKISFKSGPYIVDGYEPHEAEVRKRNPVKKWVGLTEEERKAILSTMKKPFYVHDLYAAIEAKLKEKNT